MPTRMIRAESLEPEVELSSATVAWRDRSLQTLSNFAAEGLMDESQLHSAAAYLDLAIETILGGRRFSTVVQSFSDHISRVFPDQPAIARKILEECTNVLISVALEDDIGFSGRVLETVLDIPDRIAGVQLLDESTALARRNSHLASPGLPKHISEDAALLAMFETATVGICMAAPNGRINRVNQRLLDILGLSGERVIGALASSLLRSYFRLTESQLQVISEYTLGNAPGLSLESVIDRPDGSSAWIAADSSSVTDEHGHVQYILGFVEDVTDRRAAWRVQRNSEERIQALFQNSSDVIGIVSEDGLLEFVSESIERILGYSQSSLIGHDVLDIVAEENRSKLQDVFESVLETPRQTGQAAARLIHTNGSWRWMEVDFTNLMDVPSVKGVVITARDVTKRKSFEQQLERLAYYDSLTALPNRMHFRERLDAALAESVVTGRPLAVVFLDLDRFKMINDRYGHDGGDSTLMAVGQRILDTLRPGEMVARLGGDEFALIIENASRSRALQTATRIIRALEQQFPGHQRFFTIGASAGIAMSSPTLDQPNELLRAADIALYRSKALGGGVANLFHPDMFEEALAQGELERDLQLALDRQEMAPWFQPEYDLVTGELCGLEVLMRWNRPDGAVDVPERFVRVAEELGIIVPLGMQILAEACELVAAWNVDRAPTDQIPISFNVSPREISLPEYPDRIATLLQEKGFDPSLLSIEVDERIVLEASPELERFVRSITSLGVNLVIDSFGGGYASWNQVRRLRASRVKIDRDAVGHSSAGEADLTVLKALVTIATTIGVVVTAVGLADAHLVEHTRAIGCHRGQGSHLCPPLPAIDVPSVLFNR